MGAIQSTIRARGAAFPITVISAQSAFFRGSAAQWNIVAPDPGTLNAGDVVIVHLAIQNGRDDVPQPSGWDSLSGGSAGDLGQFKSTLFGRRMASGGTVSLDDRTWPFFVSTLGSSARISTVVLRGVRNLGGPVSGEASVRFTIVDASLGVPAGLETISRPANPILSMHMVHTASGAISGPPVGWTSILESVDSGGTQGGTYYIEVQQNSSVGTTTAAARTTSPFRRATALVDVYAP